MKKTNLREDYVSPQIEQIEIQIEKGFATSLGQVNPTDWAPGNDNWFKPTWMQ